MSQRCILTIHAHPDDESSKGAGALRKYADDGVRGVLVCCTGGELGDIANPAMHLPGIMENLPEVRLEELRRATGIIGFDVVEMLGYRDSGMADSPGNDDPRSFHRADLDEAVGRLVAIIRRERPQILLTYGDDQKGYPHPDHLKVHEISIPAFERAGDPAWYPEAGEPWQPLKLYYSTWAKGRILNMHAAFERLGLTSPYDEKWLSRLGQDTRITTRIDVRAYYHVRKAALISHATQIDPTSPFWFGLPDDVAAEAWPWEDYICARDLTGSGATELGGLDSDAFGESGGEGHALIEYDFFAGIASNFGTE
jgi:mycothiol S-conjugate amidase